MRRILWLALLGAAACQSPPPPPAPTVDPNAARAELRSLLGSLERSFYSHWGAVEATAEYRKLREDQLPLLAEIVDANGPDALMALRVLAKRDPSQRRSVSARAIIYWGALQRENYFNRWGLITKSGFVPAVYGAELLELGAASTPYLQRSLQDARRAPVFGGSDERESRIRGDRVCDYAWVFLATIHNRPLNYTEDPRLRDDQIQALDLWLDRRPR